MLKETLKNHRVILASGSPRRQAFFRELGIDFTVILRPIDEVFPDHLKGAEISDYLAVLKAKAFEGDLKSNDILVTSDTIVLYNGIALGKPQNREEALTMIQGLSGDTHKVITSVCLTSPNHQIVFNDTTQVSFVPLIKGEIEYYVDNYEPYDKAGAYGIQEWIGSIAISKIEGSYNNVVGLPTQKLYETLKDFASAS